MLCFNFFATLNTQPLWLLIQVWEHTVVFLCRWPFTNYVYKRRGVSGQKNRLYVNIYTIENVNGGGVGGQKKPNLENVVCERPLI